MNIKQSFDISIRDKFLHGEECLPGIKSTDISEFGRLVNGKIRETYFTDDFGKILLSSMPTDVVDAYKNGKGNEIDNGKFFSVQADLLLRHLRRIVINNYIISRCLKENQYRKFNLSIL